MELKPQTLTTFLNIPHSPEPGKNWMFPKCLKDQLCARCYGSILSS